MKIDMGKRGKGISSIWVNEREFKKFVKEVWKELEKRFKIRRGFDL